MRPTLAALIGCGIVVGCVEAAKAILAHRLAQEEEAEEKRDEDTRENLLQYAQSYVQGAIAGITAQAGPMHPGRVEEVREMLRKAGVAEGRPVSFLMLGGNVRYNAVPKHVELQWSEQAEGIAVIYRLAIESAKDAEETVAI